MPIPQKKSPPVKFPQFTGLVHLSQLRGRHQLDLIFVQTVKQDLREGNSPITCLTEVEITKPDQINFPKLRFLPTDKRKSAIGLSRIAWSSFQVVN